MVYRVIREELIPLVEGRRIGDKKYLFKNVCLRLTEKELIFAEKGRSYKYTIRLAGITKLRLLRKKLNKAIKYKIQINGFEFYGDPRWFHLIKERISEKILT